MSKKRREIAAANTNYIKHQIITHNRRRWLWPTLYSNTPKYTIDHDIWLARHGGGKSIFRSNRARRARYELELFQLGMPPRFICKYRQNIEAKLKATPHPKFKPS